MGIDKNDVQILIKASFQYLTRTCHQWAKEHPFVSGVLLFFYLLHIFFPSVFRILFYSFPLVICTAITLGRGRFGPDNKNSKKREEDEGMSDCKYSSIDVPMSRRTHRRLERSKTESYKEGMLVISRDVTPMDDFIHKIVSYDELAIKSSSTNLSSSDHQQETHNNKPVENQSGAEAESPGEDDEEDEEEEQEELRSSNKVVEWTEYDQRNLMDLGSSELERNRRLESLIAKRRARKLLSMQPIRRPPTVTPSMDPHQLGQVGPIAVARALAEEKREDQPGSAPSLLLSMRNPFDLPYDPTEEKPVLTGGSFEEEIFGNSEQEEPKDPLLQFTRHESFCYGNGIMVELKIKDDDPVAKSLPGFMTKPRSTEKPGFTRFRRESDAEETIKAIVEELCQEANGDKSIEQESQREAELSVDQENSPKSNLEFNISQNEDQHADSKHKENLQLTEDQIKYQTEIKPEDSIQINSEESTSSSSSSETSIYAIKNEAFRNSVRKVLTCVVLPRHKLHHARKTSKSNAPPPDPPFDTVPPPTKMEERSYYTECPRHAPTYSIASDMHVEVSETGSSTAMSVIEDENLYDGDVDKDANSGDEELWGASPHPINAAFRGGAHELLPPASSPEEAVAGDSSTEAERMLAEDAMKEALELFRVPELRKTVTLIKDDEETAMEGDCHSRRNEDEYKFPEIVISQADSNSTKPLVNKNGSQDGSVSTIHIANYNSCEDIERTTTDQVKIEPTIEPLGPVTENDATIHGIEPNESTSLENDASEVDANMTKALLYENMTQDESSSDSHEAKDQANEDIENINDKADEDIKRITTDQIKSKPSIEPLDPVIENDGTIYIFEPSESTSPKEGVSEANVSTREEPLREKEAQVANSLAIYEAKEEPYEDSERTTPKDVRKTKLILETLVHREGGEVGSSTTHVINGKPKEDNRGTSIEDSMKVESNIETLSPQLESNENTHDEPKSVEELASEEDTSLKEPLLEIKGIEDASSSTGKEHDEDKTSTIVKASINTEPTAKPQGPFIENDETVHMEQDESVYTSSRDPLLHAKGTKDVNSSTNKELKEVNTRMIMKDPVKVEPNAKPQGPLVESDRTICDEPKSLEDVVSEEVTSSREPLLRMKGIEGATSSTGRKPDEDNTSAIIKDSTKTEPEVKQKSPAKESDKTIHDELEDIVNQEGTNSIKLLHYAKGMEDASSSTNGELNKDNIRTTLRDSIKTEPDVKPPAFAMESDGTIHGIEQDDAISVEDVVNKANIKSREPTVNENIEVEDTSSSATHVANGETDEDYRKTTTRDHFMKSEYNDERLDSATTSHKTVHDELTSLEDVASTADSNLREPRVQEKEENASSSASHRTNGELGARTKSISIRDHLMKTESNVEPLGLATRSGGNIHDNSNSLMKSAVESNTIGHDVNEQEKVHEG